MFLADIFRFVYKHILPVIIVCALISASFSFVSLMRKSARRAAVLRSSPARPQTHAVSFNSPKKSADGLAPEVRGRLSEIKTRYGLAMTPPKGWAPELTGWDGCKIRFVEHETINGNAPSIEVYADEGWSPKSLDQIEEGVVRGGGEFTRIARSKTAISGYKGFLETYRAKFGPTYTYMRLTFTSDRAGYEVLCRAPDDTFNQLTGVFGEFLKSLRVSPPPAQ